MHILTMFLPTVLGAWLPLSDANGAKLDKRSGRPVARFEFNVVCSELSNSDCSMVKNIAIKAGKLISSSVLIRRTILVKLEFKPMEDKETGESSSNVRIFGGVSQVRFQTARKQGGQLLRYPQALVKQVSNNQFSGVDITIVANSEVEWYFGNGPIEVGLFDFEYFLVRELTHGLGFHSLFEPRVNSATNEGYIIPEPKFSGVLTKFLPTIAFQSLLHTGNQSVLELSSRIQSYPPMAVGLFKYIQMFEKSKGMFPLAVELYKMATNDELQVQLKNSSLKLYCPQEFSPGSINRLDPSLFPTEEFMMTAMTPLGMTLKNEMEKRGMRQVYGPLTLQVLEELGYSTSKSPKIQKFELDGNLNAVTQDLGLIDGYLLIGTFEDDHEIMDISPNTQYYSDPIKMELDTFDLFGNPR